MNLTRRAALLGALTLPAAARAAAPAALRMGVLRFGTVSWELDTIRRHGLDAANGVAIADLIFALNASRGATLFLVTHEENLARRCQRVVRLQGGRIVSDA